MVEGAQSDEEWEAKVVRAVDAYRENDPEGWDAYLAESEEWEAGEAEADADIAAGRTTFYASSEEFLASLDPEENE